MSKPEFNPAEHTVSEVVEHIDTNPDDRDRVIEAEQAGKARKGVIGESMTTDNLGRAVIDGKDYLGRSVS